MPKKGSYDTVNRLMTILKMILESKTGVAVDELIDAFGQGKKRTIYRDLERLSMEFPIYKDDKTGRWMKTDGSRTPIPGFTVTVDEAIALKFGESYIKSSLRGTLIQDWMTSLYAKVDSLLTAKGRNLMEQFSEELSFLPYAFKKPQKSPAVIRALVDSLTNLLRITVTYQHGEGEESHVFGFDPYRIITAKGGLYLVGRTHPGKKMRTLAVERIRAIRKLTESFMIPEDFDLAVYQDGAFGIISAPPEKVVVSFSGFLYAYLNERIWPGLISLRKKGDAAVMELRVGITSELTAWILSFGEMARVLEPASLARDIGSRHRKACEAYSK